jgi:hypothetical protein
MTPPDHPKNASASTPRPEYVKETQQVIDEEYKEIARRRDQVFPKQPEWTPEEVKDDLVGLALSGGGIRSAMFNLGLLQALYERGLFRYFDYLSTVSGGSYIGAQLSSQLHRERHDPSAQGEPDPFPQELRRKEDGSQPPRVLRFIRNGNYLGKPWEFTVHYLIGLALNLVVFTSGLLVVCALVALGWRMLDVPWLRDQMAFNPRQLQDWLRWWTQDLQRAFMPCAFFFLFYGALWLAKQYAAGRPHDIRWFRRAETLVALVLLLALLGPLTLWLASIVAGSEWPGNWLFLACGLGILAVGVVAGSAFLWVHTADEAKERERRGRWLARFTAWARWAAWLSVLVGGVVVLGNGDTSLGPVSYLIPDRYLIYNSRYENHSILDFSFLPDAFKITGYVLGGIAVAVVVLLAMLPFVAPGKVFASGQKPDQPRTLYLFRVIATATLLGMPLLTLYLLARENVSGRAGRGKLLGLKVSDKWEEWEDAGELPRVTGVRIVRRFPDPTGLVVSDDESLGLLSNSEPTPNAIELILRGRLWYAVAPTPVRYVWTEDPARLAGVLGSGSGGVLNALVAEVYAFNPEIIVPGYQEMTCSLNYPRSRHGRRTGSEKMLRLTPVEYVWREDPAPLAGVVSSGSGGVLSALVTAVCAFEDGTGVLKLQLPEGASLPEDLDIFWVDITYLLVSDLEMPSEENEGRGSLGILAANRPNVAKSGADQSPVLTSEKEPFRAWLKGRLYGTHPPPELKLVEQDQLTRLQVLLIALPVFLLSGFVVSFNWTSLHRFYRNRLAEAYIEPPPGPDRRIALSKLNNPTAGEPYPLISATLHLLGYRRDDERNWTFLFSPRYCGSEVTGYRTTREALVGGYDDLTSVTAVSGAAVSAAQSDFLALAVLMILTNFQLGQWLPHPARPRRWGTPSAFALLTDLAFDAEDRARCFLSDGGNSENLGLLPLLQRRCRLIVVSDASQDKQHSLQDFLKLCRRIRLDHGVQFFDLFTDRPIDLEAIQLREDHSSRYHFFAGRVCYPAGFMRSAAPAAEGYLVYLKPSLTLDEDLDLLRHFHYFRPFPHDPTLEQLYDEDKVESYRQLGQHIGETLCHPIGGEGPGPGGRVPAIILFRQCLALAPALARLIEEERRTDETLQRWRTDREFRRQVAARVEELLNPN